ncbi:alpha/beta fold hydrolase [Kitasatospora sp. NPDC093558]|uniref:thioesterase II family protein n=1 Tax=Kitasatospora sp. NPDC093558 TaxID=3155201 RepID=UPI00341C095D
MRQVRPGSRWFTSFGEPAGAVCEVVCFPHAGGASAAFRGWQRHTAALAVTSARLPGREGRIGEPPLREMSALVDGLVAGLRPPRAGRPYALYGHSMGALVAFELVRRVWALGLPLPVALFVSGRDAPQYADAEQVHHLPDGELLDRLRKWDSTADREQPQEEPQELPQYAELMRLLLPTIRADLTLAETYRYVPGPPLPVPVRVLRGSHDPLVRPGHAGWARQSSVGCAVREFSGGHFFVQDHERSVVEFLETALAGLPAQEPPEEYDRKETGAR